MNHLKENNVEKSVKTVLLTFVKVKLEISFMNHLCTKNIVYNIIYTNKKGKMVK